MTVNHALESLAGVHLSVNLSLTISYHTGRHSTALQFRVISSYYMPLLHLPQELPVLSQHGPAYRNDHDGLQRKCGYSSYIYIIKTLGDKSGKQGLHDNEC